MAESNFTVRVDDVLKEAFTKAAKAADRTGGQLIRDFMRDYIREREEYDAWVCKKVEAAREDLKAGRVFSEAEASAYMAKVRAAMPKRRGGRKL
jgi:predicted transcriptional regulator